MLNSIPNGKRVINVSTDGFLTSATIEQIDVRGPACVELAASRVRLSGDPSLLEYKKQALQIVAPRNRASFTAMRVEGSKAITAKGSIKVPQGVEDANDFLLGVYLDRTAETAIPREDLISLRQQWEDNADLVSVQRVPRINLEPDHKRSLLDARMVVIGGGPHAGREHLATRSMPYETADDMLEVRMAFEGWRHTTNRCLKNIDDWDDWQDYLEGLQAARQAGRRSRRTAGGSADDLKRQFLRALVRSEWGLDTSVRRYKEVAEWLSGAGFPTTETAVKNARRGSTVPKGGLPQRGAAELVPHSVAATERTLSLLRVILVRHPTFQYQTAFVAGHLQRVEAFLALQRPTIRPR